MLWLCVVGWVASGSAAAVAQPASPCSSLLTAAEAQYVDREFADAEAFVRSCLAQPDVGDEEAVQAHRLLALIALRQDDLPGAREAALRLLALSFDYEPDPVQDPPAYVALVASVKEQLRVAQVQGRGTEAAGGVLGTPGGDPEADAESEGTGPAAEPRPPRKRSGLTKWLLIGSGVVAAGVAAVLISSGGTSSPPTGGDPLPPPPAFPR
ncbi:MAG: hypothetical protein R3362_08050 [Rhodothermales bacterium]|nr:hypothetical protein [Rhodothermales bacterium]